MDIDDSRACAVTSSSLSTLEPQEPIRYSYMQQQLKMSAALNTDDFRVGVVV